MAVSATYYSKHACSLCLNADEARNGATIFLDVQGTLIDEPVVKKPVTLEECSQLTLSRLHKKQLDPPWRHTRDIKINPTALKNLNALIEKVQLAFPVHIVLCCSWCHAGTLQELREEIFNKYEFSKLIIGKTPPSDRKKDAPEHGMRSPSFESEWKKKYGEISFHSFAKVQYWLRKHKFEEANFVILSPRGQFRQFGSRFICTEGFEWEKASFLNKTDAGLAADRLLEPRERIWRYIAGKGFSENCDEWIRSNFPNRLMVGCQKFECLDDKIDTLNFIVIASKKVSHWYGKLLTPKGYSEKSPLMTFPQCPCEFPSWQKVLLFKEKLTCEIQNRLLENKEKTRKKYKSEKHLSMAPIYLEISTGFLKEILDVCEISGDYFPTDTTTKISVSSGGTVLFAVGEGVVSFEQVSY